jgi:polyvinyl alcohol dehydrogenase (cytochrome)
MTMTRGFALVFALTTIAAGAAAAGMGRAQQTAGPGDAVYKERCASCHDQVDARIPTRAALEQMSPSRILKTLDFGAMMSIAYPMRRDEREAVARFLGRGTEDPRPPTSAFCASTVQIMSGPARDSWPGWSPDATNARFQSSDRAGLRAADLPNLELKWAYGFAGDVIAFAAPTVVNGTLFVGSAGGTVQALDAASGCIHWRYEANAPVRTGMAVATDAGATTLVFSDQNGSVHAVDASTGGARWRKRPEAHEATRLTGTPAMHDGVVFVPAASWEETRSIDPTYPCCTFRGSITAMRARDGSVLWQTYLVDPPQPTGKTTIGTPTLGPSGAGVWSTPTIDAPRGLLYITTGDNYSHPANHLSDAIVALELTTGRVAWSQQTTPNDVYNSDCGRKGPNCPEDAGPDFDYGGSAILVRTSAGRQILVAGQKSGVVYALDPDRKGAILWQTRVGKGGTNGGVQWGMTTDGRLVYAAVSDVVRPPGGTSGPAPIGNANLGGAEGGGLTALDLDTGKPIWFAAPAPCAPPRPGCSPAQPGALTAIDGAVFSGSMDGHVRAFATADGRVIWDVDTRKPFQTVNGVTAHGGSLDGAGPVVVGGMLFVNSGYPRFGGTPGNVLLAFGLRR